MTEVNRKIHVIGINSYKFEDLSFKLQNLFLETENIGVPNSYFEEIKSWSKNDLLKNESRVKAYILKDCPWSKRAIRLLNSLSIAHEVTLIDNDESFQKIRAQSSHNTFPQIFLDNKFFGGYDELSEQAKLDNLISFK